MPPEIAPAEGMTHTNRHVHTVFSYVCAVIAAYIAVWGWLRVGGSLKT